MHRVAARRQTRLLPADADGIARAADVLRSGGLVAFPTETVYGLGANALDPAAVARVYAPNGRPPYNPPLVHISPPPHPPMLAAPGPGRPPELPHASFPRPFPD